MRTLRTNVGKPIGGSGKLDWPFSTSKCCEIKALICTFAPLFGEVPERPKGTVC